jgi:hypothetical protein
MDLEQLEAFALGDRDAALAQLVPGTEDHDYARALVLQARGAFAEVDALLADWRTRHGQTERWVRIDRRQLLHALGTLDPAALDRVRDELDVELDHQADLDSERPRRPTRLDPSVIDPARLIDHARRRDTDLRGVTDEGLIALLDVEGDEPWRGAGGGDPAGSAGGAGGFPRGIDAPRRRALLQRVPWTPRPRLVQVIAADLADKTSQGFGSLPIHAALTRDQLDALAAAVPALRAHPAWVGAYLQRLLPPAHVDLAGDPDARAAYLDALWAFVVGLPAAFNPLRASVAWHRLAHDRARGRYDRARLVDFLRVPRRADSTRRAWISGIKADDLADLARHAPGSPFPVVSDPEPVVRDALHHFLAREDGTAFAEWLDAAWLERELATARLLAGDPDVERWTTKLGAAAAAALRDRVDLDLAPDNPTRHAADAAVALAVDVKHVPALTVKVFRIDELAYFLAHGRQVSTDLDLDGLTGGFEQALRFDAPPMHRVRRMIELPACARPGTYVVELIGNGKASRALIRKGRLRYAARIGAAGTVVTIADDHGRPVDGASDADPGGAAIWSSGREYRPGPDGAITLPFSTSDPGRVLLVGGGVTMLEQVPVVDERYALHVQVALEREALAAGGTARALIRARLTVAGAPAPISLLTSARVEITTTDGHGVASSREQPITLADDHDPVVEWAMPTGVAQVTLAVRGKVRSISQQRDVDLAETTTIAVAEIHRGSELEALYLAHTTDGWVISVLGKTGEPRRRRQVNLQLHHRAVHDEISVALETDDRGRIELGPLPGVLRLGAATASISAAWPLAAAPAHAQTVTVVEGTPAVMPLSHPLRGDAELAAATLVELRHGAPLRDAGELLRAEPGALIAIGLPAGDYVLAHPRAGRVAIRVVPAATPVVAGWAMLPAAAAELSPRRARLGAVEVGKDSIRIEVLDAGPRARVHVVATRLASTLAGAGFVHAPRAARHRDDPAVVSQYQSGRELGDEYRYVIERRTSPRRPGLMLDRPGLLLNPWAVRATSTGVAVAAAGGAYAPAAARFAAPSAPAPRPQAERRAVDHAAFATHDFVPRPPVVLANLRPDASGAITVERAALAGMGEVTIYVVDPGAVCERRVALPEVTEPPLDLRLRAGPGEPWRTDGGGDPTGFAGGAGAGPRGIDPERHVIERKDVVGLAAGDTLVIDDLAAARAELVDTVGKAYRYLLALSGDADLREWGFVATWHEHSDADKRAAYSKYACHELHLFLHAKDRAFFDAVVRPYLAHKQPRTFVDRWLLGEDLTAYTQPWRLGRLNTVERCLLIGAVRGPIADAVRRSIGDAVDLIPPDPERDGALIDGLLGASALAPDAELEHESFGAAMKGGLADRAMLEQERSIVTLAAPAAAGGGGAPPSPPKLAKKRARVAAAEESLDEADAPYDGDLARRDQAAPHYRGADLTQEWAEHDWWHTRPAIPGADFIAPNRFWRDFAAHRAGTGTAPFLSPHLGLCTSRFAELLCALAVLELPFVAGAHATQTAEGRLTVRAATHTLVARRQLAEVAAPAAPASILIGQHLVRADDRTEWDGAEEREKHVTGELLAGVVYTDLVAVTNPTSAPVRVELLVQIPRGAIAVDNGVATRTVHLALDAYGTATHETSFYFPLPGRYVHYPAHVARKGELLAWAAPATHEVVLEPSAIDPTSWRHLAQRGTLDQVVGFLATANLGRIDASDVAWRMKDRAWFERVTAALAARGGYDDELWGYAIHHRDGQRLREWLEHQDDFLRPAGRLDAGPVAVDEAERGWHEHLEYAPLVNARAHRLGARARILNDGLAAQYRAALETIALRPATDRDRARAAHYLFTQDRLDEALALVDVIDPARAGSQLQLDYLRAYAACARGELATARTLAAPWIAHPVDRWRHRFAALVQILDEAEAAPGASSTAVTTDPESRDQRMADLAARQPAFELAVDRDGVVVDHRNLDGLELRFHPMELELLFSRQPFVQSDTTRFSFVDPGRTERLAFTGDGRTRVGWPAGLATGSVVVEAVAAGARKAVAHYAHDLLVTVAHQYGQLHVIRASDRAALPATYVKVFARQPGGAVAFYKDGYTDLRGRFDYATLSTDDLTRVERFAILVASDAAGALVLEAGAPPR